MPDSSVPAVVRPDDDKIAALDEICDPGSVPTAVAALKAALGTSDVKVQQRARAQAILAMANAKMSKAQIAKALEMKPNAVKVALWRLRSKGLLNDLRDILENDSAALAVDSLNYHLKKKDPDLTAETLKGLGFFKNHSHAKHEGGGSGFTMPPLQVNVVFGAGAVPLPGQAPDFSEAVVGTPRVDE